MPEGQARRDQHEADVSAVDQVGSELRHRAHALRSSPAPKEIGPRVSPSQERDGASFAAGDPGCPGELLLRDDGLQPLVDQLRHAAGTRRSRRLARRRNPDATAAASSGSADGRREITVLTERAQPQVTVPMVEQDLRRVEPEVRPAKRRKRVTHCRVPDGSAPDGRGHELIEGAE